MLSGESLLDLREYLLKSGRLGDLRDQLGCLLFKKKIIGKKWPAI
jgi:hypothetical protein